MSDKLPAAASNIVKTYPEVWKAYGAFGKAISDAGPLERRAINLQHSFGL